MLTPTPIRFAAFHAESYLVTGTVDGVERKLFQIGFARSDASLFVHFPYFKPCRGILGEVTMGADLNYPTTMQLGKSFPATNHAVKYSHHPSGRAHFSLTGKVLNSVGRNAARLDAIEGHIFTVMLQGFDSFLPRKTKDRSTVRRGVIPCNMGTTPTEALKFVAQMWSEREVLRHVRRGIGTGNGPWLHLLAKDGSKKLGILLTTPIKFAQERRYLVMSLEPRAKIAPHADFQFTFLGGFDERTTAFDHSKETSCLLALYPESRRGTLPDRTSIDL